MSVKTVPTDEYVAQVLGDRDFILSDNIPLYSDFDYVMSLMIVATYDCQRSKYMLEFLGGNTSKGRYTLPNMKISKKT
jgi:hypothetical protein